MVREYGTSDIDYGRGKPSAIPSVVLDLHAPAKECGQEEDRGKNEHGAQYDSIGNRRADHFTNSGDEKGGRQEHHPHRNGAASYFFGVGIRPGKQLRHKENRGQREIHNEDEVPSGARLPQRRPDHRAKGGDQVEQNVAEDASRVDRAQRREGRRFPFSPARERARDASEKQRP